MKNYLSTILIIVTSLLFCNKLIAGTTRYTVQDGAWTSAATWGGTLPQWDDIIVVRHNVTGADVSIDWNQSINVDLGATLSVTNITFGNGVRQNNIYGTIIATQDVTNSASELIIESTGKIMVGDDYENRGGSGSILTVNGLLEVTDDFNNTGSAIININTGGEIIVHSNFDNGSDADFYIDGGTLTIDDSFNNQGDGYFSITNGGSISIGKDMQNIGGSEFDIQNGSITVAGDFVNQGGSAVDIDPAGSMNISGDFTNTGGGQVALDGEMNVDGTLTNGGGAAVTGNGTLSVGVLDDKNGGVSSSLLIVSRLYAIANGNWSDGSIWAKKATGSTCNCVPSLANSVNTNNFDVDVDADFVIASLVVSANTTLNIKPTASLTVNNTIQLDGELYLRSDASNSGALLNKGAINYGANAKFISRVLLRAGEFNYIASNFSNSSSGAIKYYNGALNPNVYNYDQSAADHWGTDANSDGDITNDQIGWVPASATMGLAQGFAVYVPNNYYVNITGTESFTGNQSATIYKTLHTELPNNTLYDGWNLIGNPYPSGLNLTSFINGNTGNSDGNVYLWDDDLSSGNDYESTDYVQVNLSGAITNSKGSSFSGSLKANQGFFIKATAATNTVYFTNAMRTTENSTFISTAKSASKTAQNSESFKFYIENQEATLYNESLISFNEAASSDVDFGYDGLKRKGDSKIALYSLINDLPYGIQTLPLIYSETQVAIGFDLAKAGTFYFGVKENTLTNGVRVFLLDKETNKEFELLENQSYKFQATSGINTNRFVLIFRGKTTEIQKDLTQNSEYKVFAQNNELHIQSAQANEPIEVLVSDMLGRTATYFLNNTNETIQLAGTNQIYLVRIKNQNNQLSTYKVFAR